MTKRRNSKSTMFYLWPHLIGLLSSFLLALAAISPALGAGNKDTAEDAYAIGKLMGIKIMPIEKLETKGGKQIQFDPPRRMKVVTRLGFIPGFIEVRSASLGNQFDVRSGFLGTTPVFILSRRFSDLSQEILDIQVLPKELIDMRLRVGKERFVEFEEKGYLFSDSCSSNPNKSSQYIFALVKPEQGKEYCSHDSRQVLKAWKFDGYDTKVKEIPATGVQCSIITMYDCNQ